MPWNIREGEPSEVEAVLVLWAEAGAETTHTDDVKSLNALMERDSMALIVAVDGGQLVGSVIAGWDGWRGSIYRLVVANSHRRLGLGRELLDAAESRLSAIGAVRLQAIVVEHETVATEFWRASDWEQQTHRLRFVKG